DTTAPSRGCSVITAAIHRLITCSDENCMQRSLAQRRGLSAEMIMSNPITVGFSGLTKRILASRSKPSKLAPGVREFTGEKFDVTDEALFAVAHLLAVRDDILVFPTADGKEIHLRADIKEKQEDES
ncbi:TPA: DUF7446 family protein, partial [Citrobacter freundii]